MTNDELRKLERELCKELSIVKTAYMELGVTISDMRGQINTIFERIEASNEQKEKKETS